MTDVRVVRGRPDDVELAALVVALLTVAGEVAEPTPLARPGWAASDVEFAPAGSWAMRHAAGW